jgi:hypothetical protein
VAVDLEPARLHPVGHVHQRASTLTFAAKRAVIVGGVIVQHLQSLRRVLLSAASRVIV